MPATPDPDLALRLAKATVDLYARATENLLTEVARRLARGIDRPGWAEAKLAETAALRDTAMVELERLQVLGPDTVRAAVEEGAKAGARDVAAETPGITGPAIRTSTRAVDALVDETVANLRGTHQAILRTTLDAYRDVIAETAAPDVLTGTRTRIQAAQQGLDRFAQRGVTGFTDRAGRSWALESYTEMATRTAVGRAQVQGAVDRYQQAGRDLIIISDAPQECPACRDWEGKVLSISGATPKGTRVVGGDGARFTVAGTKQEAERGGLWHPNCRHRAGAFIEGLTGRMTDTADPEGDRARQKQRRLERGLREWKRREAAAITPDTKTTAARHRRDWSARLKAHTDHTGLLRQRHRERGPGRAR